MFSERRVAGGETGKTKSYFENVWSYGEIRGTTWCYRSLARDPHFKGNAARCKGSLDRANSSNEFKSPCELTSKDDFVSEVSKVGTYEKDSAR